MAISFQYFILWFAFTINLVHVSAVVDSNGLMRRYKFAAICASMGNECPQEVAVESYVCHPRRCFQEQSIQCRRMACHFCRIYGENKYHFCMENREMHTHCEEILGEVTPTFTPPVEPSLANADYVLESTPAAIGFIDPTIEPPTPCPSMLVLPSYSSDVSMTQFIEVSPCESDDAIESREINIETVDPSQGVIFKQVPAYESSPFPTSTYSPTKEERFHRSVDGYYTAMCLSLQESCPLDVARNSGVCLGLTFAVYQPNSCISEGCKYCGSTIGKNMNVCKDSWAIRRWCPRVFATFAPHVPAKTHKEASALCIAHGRQCLAEEALSSGHCKANTNPLEQPISCIREACSFCSMAQNAASDMCTRQWALKAVCRDMRTPSSPSPFLSSLGDLKASDSPLIPSLIPTPSPSSPPSPTRTPVVVLLIHTSTPSSTQRSTRATTTPSVKRSPEPSRTLVPRGFPRVTKTPSPIVSKNILSTSSGSCTWESNDGLIDIPLKAVKVPTSYWTTSSESTEGIEWRRGDNRTQVDSPGIGGLCFQVSFNRKGTYYFTASTMAKHWSEHNDMWVNFTGGFDLFHASSHREATSRQSPFRSLKAYQNYGAGKRADIISSVNHNPHIMVTREVKASVPYRVCISGRSSMFSIFELIFIYCEKLECRRVSAHIRDEMRRRKFSKCT